MEVGQNADQPAQVHGGSQFIDRVSTLPVVTSAMGYASETYDWLKGSNSLVNYTLTTAEKTLASSAGHAIPVVLKLEKQLSAVDNIACKGLDVAQEKLPIITKSPDEIMADTKNLYHATLEVGKTKYEGIKVYSTEKMEQLKKFGIAKASELTLPYSQLLVKIVDSALNMTEGYMDYCLPPSNEGSDASETQSSTTSRVRSLSSKARRRMHERAMLQLQQLQMRSHESIQKLKFVMDLMQQAKGQSIKGSVFKAHEYAQWLWDEVNKDEQNSGESMDPQAWDKTALTLARRTAKQIKETYSVTASAFQLPHSLNSHVGTARQYASDVYEQLNKIKSFEELSEVLLGQMKEKLQYIEGTFPLISNITHIWNYSWLAVWKQKNGEEIEMDNVDGTTESTPNCNGTAEHMEIETTPKTMVNGEMETETAPKTMVNGEEEHLFEPVDNAQMDNAQMDH